MAFSKFNPATGTCLGLYELATPEDVVVAVEKAQAVAPQWRQIPLWARADILKQWGQRILAEVDAVPLSAGKGAGGLVGHISREVGKPLSQALDGDVLPALSWLTYLEKHGPSWLQPQSLPWDKSIWMGRTHTLLRQPKGVVAVITPWNYPLAIPVTGISSALMAGNTVVFKPSELVPETSFWLFDHLLQAIKTVLGAETPMLNAVQMVYGDGTAGAALSSHPAVQHVIFTGSTQVGQQIQQHCAPKGVGLTLELGGRDAMVILRESLPDVTTSYALWGRLINAGQACAAVKQVYVLRSEQEAWLLRLSDKLKGIRWGDPLAHGEAPHMGPLISEAQRQKLHEQVMDAIEKGASCLVGGMIPEGDGYFYPPTVLVDVPDKARLATEEAFGPVLCVNTYQDPRELPEKLNASPFGLGVSIFGELPMAEGLADMLDVGMVALNDLPTLGFALPQVPWMGRKASGVGASHSPEGVLALTHTKVMTRNWLRYVPGLEKPFWHFGPKTSPELAIQMVKCFHDSQILTKCQPAFWTALFKNRGTTRW